MLKALAVCGYRSLRDLIVPLHSLNLVTGPNGSGKSPITRAAQRSQVVVVSHAPPLIDALQQLPECNSIMLTKSFGETAMAVEPDDVPAWHWPTR